MMGATTLRGLCKLKEDWSRETPPSLFPDTPQDRTAASDTPLSSVKPTDFPPSGPEKSPPMLDVHAPQEAIHGWKGFFIHIATISIGLLIAIGLEQTVEMLHHRHQLEDLHESLRQDAQKVIEYSAKVVAAESQHFDRLTARAQQIKAALDSRQPVAPPPPVQPVAAWDVPDSPAWRAAKSSGLLALMGQEEIKAYGEVDFILVEVQMAYQSRLVVAKKRRDFEYEFDRDGALDLSIARPDDLRRYLALIIDERSATEAFQHWSAEIGRVESTILHSELNLEKIRAVEHIGAGVGQAKAPPNVGPEHR
jgi:hypothetical protein